VPKYLTQEEAFFKCKKEGKFIVNEEIDIDRIKSTLAIALADIQAAEILRKNMLTESHLWGSGYKLCYDALHELAESFLKFDKIKIDNHQCLFAYLCQEYPELELNWDFFELVRTKRNGINYYGSPISYQDWKAVELQFALYLKTLETEIRKKI